MIRMSLAVQGPTAPDHQSASDTAALPRYSIAFPATADAFETAPFRRSDIPFFQRAADPTRLGMRRIQALSGPLYKKSPAGGCRRCNASVFRRAGQFFPRAVAICLAGPSPCSGVIGRTF